MRGSSSIGNRPNPPNQMAVYQPFLANFPPTTLIYFTKLRFRWSFWGAEQVCTSFGSKVMTQNANTFFRTWLTNEMINGRFWPFLANFLLPISFTELRLRWSFWGAEQVWTSIGLWHKMQMGRLVIDDDSLVSSLETLLEPLWIQAN